MPGDAESARLARSRAGEPGPEDYLPFGPGLIFFVPSRRLDGVGMRRLRLCDHPRYELYRALRRMIGRELGLDGTRAPGYVIDAYLQISSHLVVRDLRRIMKADFDEKNIRSISRAQTEDRKELFMRLSRTISNALGAQHGR